MKNIIGKILPFFGMLILAISSVVISCQTVPASEKADKLPIASINAGKMQNGDYVTIRVFDKIRGVVVSDRKDLSHRIELGPDEWEYDPETTKITIRRDLPFQNSSISVEGYLRKPLTFVLGNMNSGAGVMVILDDRLAIEGHDYTINESDKRLVFRENINLPGKKWFIQYDMKNGSASLGNWDPGDIDRLSYFKAEHRKRVLDNWYDRQDTFWFFETSGNPAQKPRLVKRKPLPEEMAAMKALPAPVIKYRGNTPWNELSSELGFNVSLPEKIAIRSLHDSYLLNSRMIEEILIDGKLVRKLHITYLPSAMGEDAPPIDLFLSKEIKNLNGSNQDDLIIDRDVIDLGLPVHKVQAWKMHVTSLEERPEVIQTSTWFWLDDGVSFSIDGCSENKELHRNFIREIISIRRK